MLPSVRINQSSLQAKYMIVMQRDFARTAGVPLSLLRYPPMRLSDIEPPKNETFSTT
ncbi:hypothetical protein PAFU01_07500 [Pantoea ananatis]|nr:hypothetical protein PAFU01_07500 [Pantoea ananatis]